MARLPHVACLLSLLMTAGCMEAKNKPADDKSGQGIFGKKTQEIGQFDNNKANQVVSDQKIHATDPITAPLSAYGPTVEKISILAVDMQMATFQALEGRYPNDYDEFMEKIIKANNVKLPVLPYKGRYMYDEANHTVVIVRTPEEAAKQ